MYVVFEHPRIDEDMEALAAAFNAELCQDCNERYFSIPEKYGEGRISSFAYDFGISLLILQGRFLTPLRIEISGGHPHPIHFHFCVKGDFRHTLNDGALSYQLNPLMGSISATPSHREQEWLYGRETEIVHANLQILRSAYLKKADCDLNKMPAALAGVFRDVEAKKSYLFESNYNLPTAECIREILTNKQKGLTRSTLIEAKAMELLSLQLQQFAEDLDPDIRSVALKKYDLEQILQAEKLLTADLQKEPTIVELARAVGINQQKLKRGFKLVFDMPVKQYLLDVRLEAARCLILEGEHSIREVANRVGYRNQSHFSKKFREKYGLLPKDLLAAVDSKLAGRHPEKESDQPDSGPGPKHS